MLQIKKIIQLFTPSEKRKMAFYLVPSIIGMMFEMMSLGMIIPLIYIIIKPDFFDNYPKLQPFLIFIGNPSHASLVILAVLFLVVFYIIKTLFLTFLCWKQNKLIFDLKTDIAYRLFTGYLKQPWVFHFQRNSAELYANASMEVSLFVHGTVLAILILITEGLVFSGLVIVLFYLEPLGTSLIVCTIGIVVWGFRKLTNQWLSHWGEDRQYHDFLRTQHLQQGLSAVKDIKLMGREKYFFEQFNAHNNASSRASRLYETFVQIPKLWFELLAVFALTLLILIMLYQQKPQELILPMVGFFAAAAFRLIPSVSRILNAIHIFEFSMPAVNKLSQEFMLIKSQPPPTYQGVLPFEKKITIENIHYKYPNTKHAVLKGISLQINAGSSVGLVGVSGSGKSTLIDIVLGLLTPNKGKIRVDGVDIQTNLRGWQDQIGFVPQAIYLIDDTLRSNIAFGIPKDKIDDLAILKAIQSAQLEDFVNALPEGLDTQVGERGVRLSGGQRQRVGIARALYHDPAVLVLDESTNALDNATEEAIMDSVYALCGKKTIIIVAHRLSTITRCNQVYTLEKGTFAHSGDSDTLPVTPEMVQSASITKQTKNKPLNPF